MFNELFQECVKEAIRPVDNPDDRMQIAQGYSKLAGLKVAELLNDVRKVVKDDRTQALAMLTAHIKDLEGVQ